MKVCACMNYSIRCSELCQITRLLQNIWTLSDFKLQQHIPPQYSIILFFHHSLFVWSLKFPFITDKNWFHNCWQNFQSPLFPVFEDFMCGILKWNRQIMGKILSLSGELLGIKMISFTFGRPVHLYIVQGCFSLLKFRWTGTQWLSRTVYIDGIISFPFNLLLVGDLRVKSQIK